MCTSFKLLFSVLTEIFDLEEIHNDRSRLWAFFLALIPQVRQELDNPSIIIHDSPRELGIFSLFRGNTFASNPGWAFKHIFKPNGFCENLLTRTFRIKNDKYPKKAHVVGGGGIFPINSAQFRSVPRASRGKCSVEMRPKTGGKRSICEK